MDELPNRANETVGAPETKRVGAEMEMGKAECVIARSRVDYSTGCWEWNNAKTPFGYGNCQYKGRMYKAHRLAYEAWHGAIPEGHVVMHTCDNPSCVNPSHLALGTQQDNIRDSVRKGRWGVRKLSLPAETRREIAESKESDSVLAERHGVSRGLIWKIKNRRLKVEIDPQKKDRS